MITPKGYYCDVATREERPILAMSPEEILERENLNIQNTTEARRKQVLSAQNGHVYWNARVDNGFHGSKSLCYRCLGDRHGYTLGNGLCRYCDGKAE